MRITIWKNYFVPSWQEISELSLMKIISNIYSMYNNALRKKCGYKQVQTLHVFCRYNQSSQLAASSSDRGLHISLKFIQKH